MPSQSVLVIGGGLAGLSCAVTLAEAGFRVRLIEMRPHLGGRAASYTLPDGSEVDNCQHVTLGCCTNLADFYRRVGAGGKIQYYEQLYFADAQGRRDVIESSILPPPLHMAPSFLRFSALTIADKRSIASALLHIARSGGRPAVAGGISMLEWLHREHQTPAAIERFWRVVLVSALDEPLARTDARYGIEVFWKAFLSNRKGYRVGIPCVPLGELYEGCRTAIVQSGGEVSLRCRVRQLCTGGGGFSGAVLEDGTALRSDACVTAVPHDVLLKLLPKEGLVLPGLREQLQNLKTSPITGVHFWFDRLVMEEPFLSLLEHTVQWVFNKSKLLGENETGYNRKHLTEVRGDVPAANGQYLQLVISASYDLVAKGRQEIIDLCLRELKDVLPATRDAKLVKATVIKEVNATFSPAPGVDRWRPAQRTDLKNFFLAGDWTRTGWPATMEGAVRSGYLAAEALLAQSGQPKKILQPDLPLEGLCKFWRPQTETALA